MWKKRKPDSANGNLPTGKRARTTVGGMAKQPPLPAISAELEQKVFTHSSVLSNSKQDDKNQCYDRLEFLGDAYVEAIATRLIWDTYGNLPAGRLSQIRELLVKNETLGEYSVMYGFDRKVSVQEIVRDSSQWAKVKGDMIEAYVAAIVLSDPINGFKAAEDWLTQLWLPKLRNVVESTPGTLRAKEELARKLLAKGVKLEYLDERPMEQLKGGMQTHFVGVYMTGLGWEKQHLGSGTGLNKVGAGNVAAAAALKNRPLIDQIIAARTAALEKQRLEQQMLERNGGGGS